MPLLVFAGCSRDGGEEETVIFAASSLHETLERMKTPIRNETGEEITIHYGSTTHLLHQVKQGAPFDLFLSASPDDMKTMTDEGYTDASSVRSFIKNDLVLITRTKETVADPVSFLEQQDLGFLALGEMNRVPLGVYTDMYFEDNEVEISEGTTQVYGKDAFQVFRYVRVSQADAGIVYGSDARRKDYPHTPLETKTEIEYQLGASKGADESAKDVADWLLSREAAGMFREGGFLPAGEESVVWQNGGHR